MSAGRVPNDTGYRARRIVSSDVASHRARPIPVSDADRNRTRRNAAVIITDPHIVVVESATVVDSVALDGALELLVRWAVRAHKRGDPVQAEAQTGKVEAPDSQAEAATDENNTTYGPGN